MSNKEQVLSVDITPKPIIRVRVIEDNDPSAIKEDKKKYPFEVYNTVTVNVKTNKREFNFDIYNGYTWNGADIPRVLWRIIGSKTDNDFLIASMLHDFILQFKNYIVNMCIKEDITIDEYRRLTSLIFREKLKKQGVNTIKANIMSWCVDVFQHYCNKKGWKI